MAQETNHPRGASSEAAGETSCRTNHLQDTTAARFTQGLAHIPTGTQILDAILRAPSDPSQAVALRLRDDLASFLGADPDNIKPCMALIAPPQQQGRRGELARVIAVTLAKAGVGESEALQYLGYFRARCAQPPRTRTTFTAREVTTIWRQAKKLHDAGKLRGFGCKSGPLAELCPFAELDDCPFYARLKRPQKRPETASLVGCWGMVRQHPRPAGWSELQDARRRLLFVAIGALEVLKGHGGEQLITSERELAGYVQIIPRNTVARDLRAMAAASWLVFRPGLTRHGNAGIPPRGCIIRRLMPGEVSYGPNRA